VEDEGQVSLAIYGSALREVEGRVGVHGAPLDEEALVQRFKEQDDEASFIRFVESQRFWLDPVALSWAFGDPEEAADLRQEVVIALYSALRRFDGRSSLRTFVWRIARNVFASMARKSSRRRSKEARAFTLDAATVEFRQRAADPSFEFERRGEDESLTRALKAAFVRLNEEDRALLSLRFGSSSSIAELAALLGIRDGALRTRLSRARRRLERQYKEARSERN